jgi:endonuclease/exonuclease/phosphatase family metal-dependent hydrolase
MDRAAMVKSELKIVLWFLIIFGIGKYSYAQYFDGLSFGTDTTFEVMTWNIEWFPKNGEQTIEYVTDMIRAVDVDVIAIQEISDTSAFVNMVNELDGYEYFYGEYYYTCLGFLYKKDVVSLNRHYEIYKSSGREFPRPPLVGEFTYMNEEFVIINNHLKCCGDGYLDHSNEWDEEKRRYDAMVRLKDLMDAHFKYSKVIVVGDYNDELTDNEDNIVFSVFIEDNENYLFADMEIAEGSYNYWSYPTYPSHLDHILVSDDVLPEMQNEGSLVETVMGDQFLSGGWNSYDYNITDHRPVAIRLKTNADNSINEISANSDFSVSPNPVKDAATFSFKTQDKQASIIISDAYGSLVEQILIQPGANTAIWKTNSVAAGLYFCTLQSNEKTKKSVKCVVIR